MFQHPTKLSIRFWRCLIINRGTSFSGCFAFNLHARILTWGTWGHMAFLISFPWLPNLIPPQTSNELHCSEEVCVPWLLPDLHLPVNDRNSTFKNFLLAASLLTYLKLHTYCQCKQELNMRCHPSLASTSSTFLSDFSLMIIFIYGTALHHSTRSQTQAQRFLWVPRATRNDRHS